MKQIVAVASASTNRNLDRSTACWPSLPDYISSLVHALSTTKMAPRTRPPINTRGTGPWSTLVEGGEQSYQPHW